MKIITLTLNPAFDVHCNIEDLKLYKENYALDIIKQPGGKGINISRALLSQGTKNTALIITGNLNETDFLKGIEKDGLTYKNITIPGRIRENITIHSKTTPETRISFEGFEINKSILTELTDIVKKMCDENTIVTFTGRIPPGVTKNEVIEFLKEIKKTNALLVCDCNSFDINDIINLKPFLIKPNEYEAGAYIGKEKADKSSALLCAKNLYEKGILNVMISLGENGLIYYGSEGGFYVCVPKLSPVSTIGAGDSTIAGFISSYEKNNSIEEIIKKSAAYGCAACLSAGTNPPIAADIEKIYKQIKCTKID